MCYREDSGVWIPAGNMEIQTTCSYSYGFPLSYETSLVILPTDFEYENLHALCGSSHYLLRHRQKLSLQVGTTLHLEMAQMIDKLTTHYTR